MYDMHCLIWASYLLIDWICYSSWQSFSALHSAQYTALYLHAHYQLNHCYMLMAAGLGEDQRISVDVLYLLIIFTFFVQLHGQKPAPTSVQNRDVCSIKQHAMHTMSQRILLPWRWAFRTNTMSSWMVPGESWAVPLRHLSSRYLSVNRVIDAWPLFKTVHWTYNLIE